MKFKNLLLGAFILVLCMLGLVLASAGCSSTVTEKVPVVFDTDTGPKEPDAWILSVRGGLVNIQIVGVKTFITFRPPTGELDRFSSHINYLVPVRLECSKVKKNKECDYSAPYKLYVSRMLVEAIKIEGSFPVRANSR